MHYEGTIFRPPSEADSLLVQVTVGCSWNKCTFCDMYSDKQFRVRNLDEIKADLVEGSRWRDQIRRIFLCDGDALVVEVIKDGPACHLGTDSCFANLLFRDEEVQRFSLEALYALLEGRNAQRPEGSYTTYLFEKGREKILKKVGEECTEVIIGAMKGSREETIYEISDLCYHVLVLMVAEGITLDDIRAELASRHVIDHKVKQETMQ